MVQATGAALAPVCLAVPSRLDPRLYLQVENGWCSVTVFATEIQCALYGCGCGVLCVLGLCMDVVANNHVARLSKCTVSDFRVKLPLSPAPLAAS